MKCPHCGEEMVAGKFRAGEGSAARPAEPDPPRWNIFLERGWTRLSNQPTQVCWRCGLMILFVKNPTLFRPKTGTERLPRPAGTPSPDTTDLPSPATTPSSGTDTLPGPAAEPRASEGVPPHGTEAE